jgi:hypothetical protein
MTAAGAMALVLGFAAVACAAPADDVTVQPNKIGPPAPRSTLQFDQRKGRWGLSLDMTQPAEGAPNWSDTRVGVTYRVAPGLHTGASVTLGPEETPDGRKLNGAAPAPRVRLETTFKF